ncbi:MAG: ABC transporter substrate-binding protein [Candidatus Hydrogenedentota bacterium]
MRRLGLTTLTVASLIAACQPREAAPREYVATIAPLAQIISEVAGDRAAVRTLLQPGTSPHTYEPRPSDIRTTEQALAVFFVDESLDGWAARLPGATKVSALALVPESFRLSFEAEDERSGEHEHGHDHGRYDPHFWGDPLAVKAMLPELVERLSELDPEGSTAYAQNAKRFAAELEQINHDMDAQMAPLAGAPVVQFHPSWNYFLRRYGLRPGALVEPSPGKEATAQHIAEVAETIKRVGIKAVFTEPQLARRPAEVVAEAGGVPVFELDPIGGVSGKMTYEELIRSNATVLLEALQ